MILYRLYIHSFVGIKCNQIAYVLGNKLLIVLNHLSVMDFDLFVMCVTQ